MKEEESFWKRYQLYFWSTLFLGFITLGDFPVTLVFTGPLFILLVLAFIFQKQWQWSQADAFVKRCGRIGVEAETWDELLTLEEKHKRIEQKRFHWSNSGISLERVDKIETYLQKLVDKYLPLFDGLPQITAHLVNYELNTGPSSGPKLLSLRASLLNCNGAFFLLVTFVMLV